jgi:hypothetical protein
MTSYNIEWSKHGCTFPDCKYAESDVCHDDEPFCFEHSPDEGSSVFDYSYKTTHERDFEAEDLADGDRRYSAWKEGDQ